MKVKICPKCKSTNVKLHSARAGIIFQESSQCADCGYEGIFPETDKEYAKKIQLKQ